MEPLSPGIGLYATRCHRIQEAFFETDALEEQEKLVDFHTSTLINLADAYRRRTIRRLENGIR